MPLLSRFTLLRAQATGTFNSLIKLEGSNSHPYNPMINSGAIAVASYIEPKISFEEHIFT